ncbi:MAG TPA: DUF4126 domain-containing protein [Candidatus Limnocylindria bacterium]|nr:DUF4126 domain-containing protein [Candidatus Limnocylindria bacterium]
MGVLAGLALSVAVGFRVFVPLLLTGAAARLGYLELTTDMAWLGSDAALVALATATVIEVSAYYVPWLDNLLDTLATPVAILAGVLAWAAVTPEIAPLLRWTLAVVAGGGAAALVQSGTALARLHSSAFTAGLGNPVVATGELAGSVSLSVLAVLAPVLAGVLVVLVLVGLSGFYRRATSRRNAAPYSKP